MEAPIFDLVFIRKPNITGTSIGTIIKFERVTGDMDLTPEVIASTISNFFTQIDESSIDASEPVATVIANLKSTNLTPAQANDNLAVLKYYGYEFMFIQRIDLTSDEINENAEARGYLLLPQTWEVFSVPMMKLGWGVNFSTVPAYPIGVQAIQELMSVTPEFSRYVPIIDNREFFKSLQEKGQVDYYDNLDSEEFMKALGYEFLLIA